MTFFNPFFRATECKIVLAGPTGSGKGTILSHLRGHYRDAVTERRSSPPGSASFREHHFFLPSKDENGKATKVRCSVYAQRGNGKGVEARGELRWLLKGVDGVMFVADAQPARFPEATESFDLLRTLLLEQHTDLEHLGLVLVANKQDLDVGASSDLRAALNLPGARTIETIANEGSKVIEAFEAVTRSILDKVRDSGRHPRSMVTAT